jgi:low affinity Fe/Cu permease
LLFVQPDHARDCRRPRESKDGIVKNNDGGELKGDQRERGLFGVVRDAFRVFARRSSAVLGTAWAFAFAILVIAVWAVTGPKFHYSDTWQLIINTGTTIVTFLMVFVIQNTQNRDGKAIQLKLDELIRALKGARNKLVDLEDLSDEELKQLEKEFQRLHQQSRETDSTGIAETESQS